jgi:hypothetical protein
MNRSVSTSPFFWSSERTSNEVKMRPAPVNCSSVSQIPRWRGSPKSVAFRAAEERFLCCLPRVGSLVVEAYHWHPSERRDGPVN